MDMFGRYEESMKLKSAFAAIAVQSLQEEADVILNHEESSPLPGRERYE